ncbi:DUF1836 domain-containing protein [Acutalibacter caecimuris]|uniref:DUF1836 domain-containing protein n=1 Tax=Acutalibacter caecimuris TaxID=3093657 RepID=UPI002AC9CC61|nr:DUF1836 domain-containing protein [Acutalibacter sp. M00118]
MDTVEKILAWAKEGAELIPPDWKQLPAIPLYIDQVLLYLSDSLRFFQRDEDAALLTSSMINNYVKNGVLPHPEKKKYTQQHLAALIAICMLKQVLALPDIATLLHNGAVDPALYETFRNAHTGALRQTCRELEENCQSGESLRHQALRLAAEANAKRAAAERILCALAAEET